LTRRDEFPATHNGLEEPGTIYGPPGSASIVDRLFDKVFAIDIGFALLGAKDGADIRKLVQAQEVSLGLVHANDHWRVLAECVDQGNGLGLSREDWPCLGGTASRFEHCRLRSDRSVCIYSVLCQDRNVRDLVAEKGVTWMKIRARGEPGHGSLPHDQNAVLYLAQAPNRIGRARYLPVHLAKLRLAGQATMSAQTGDL
jgi:hypothetical protein